MANRAHSHLPQPEEHLRPEENRNVPARAQQDAPRAGRTGGAGVRAERPFEKTDQKTANAPQPGRGGNGPKPARTGH